MTFRPKIIVFCCNWCAYAGGDLAGISRYQIKPHFRVIRTMCSARVDPEWILEAFRLGADGVMVVGWRPNECQFKNGNYTAQRHVDLANRILESRGLESQRVNMYWLSGAESEKLVKSVEDALEKIRRAGPNPINTMDMKPIKKKRVTTPVEWILK